MKGLLVLAFLALSCFTLGQSLDCNACTLQINGVCQSRDFRKMTCTDTTQKCGIIKVSSGLFFAYTRYQCVNPGVCGLNNPVDQTTGIGSNTTCCETNLCNSGPTGARLSLLSGAGILSLWLLTMS